MNGYEIFGRLIITIVATIILFGFAVGIWLGMLGDVWNVGPMKKALQQQQRRTGTDDRAKD